jgi:hypothetical protein
VSLAAADPSPDGEDAPIRKRGRNPELVENLETRLAVISVDDGENFAKKAGPLREPIALLT